MRFGGKPIEGFSLKPEPHDPPAVITVAYDESDIAGRDADKLRLYRQTLSGWEDATCAGYQVQRFPGDGVIAVPVCQTRTSVLSGEALRSFVYLPAVFRNY